MSKLSKFLRSLFSLVINLVVMPIGIVLYILLESLRIAKSMEIIVDKIKRGKK